MRRRGSASRGGGGRFVDMLVFVVVLGLVMINLYITMRYFYNDAKRQEASQPTAEASAPDTAAAVAAQAEVDGGAKPDADQGELDDDKEEIPELHRPGSGWPFQDLDDIVRRLTSRKHWGPNISRAASASAESGSLVLYDVASADFSNQRDEENWSETYQLHNRLMQHTGCDLLTIPFAPQQDGGCISYLTNTSKWRAFKPLAMGFDQRTIKFEVEFDPIVLDNGVSVPLLGSILKVPQKLFPNEAFSEVAAFHADRALRVNRIPPTGWVCIPVSLIRSSVAQYGSTVETVDEFLEESKAHNYTEWVEKDLFQYVERTHGFGTTVSIDGNGTEPCIGASIQLRVADVAHLLDSVLKIPYVPHNESWFRFFDLLHHHDADLRPLFYRERFSASIVHISEINTFDFVIGNGDRSPNKNNFVVGGCSRRHECGNKHHDKHYLRHPQHPTFVHLDQGMGFYGNPRRNPILESVNRHKNGEEDTFCLFRARLINRIAYLHEIVEGSGRDATSRFERLMTARLPEGVRSFVTPHVLKLCHDRMTKLLHLVERCQHAAGHRIKTFVMAP